VWREQFHLRLPHGVVEGMAVDKDNRRTGARVLVGQIDSVGELNPLQHDDTMLSQPGGPRHRT
jgi:hypothetical protein